MVIYIKFGPICQAKSGFGAPKESRVSASRTASRQERPDDPEDEPGIPRRLPEGLEEEIPALEAVVDEVVKES